jgi:hypothetical protein
VGSKNGIVWNYLIGQIQVGFMIAFVFSVFIYIKSNEHRKLTKSRSYFCRRKHSFIKQERLINC